MKQIGQDQVFHRSVPALYLALCHWVIGASPSMGHSLITEVTLEFARYVNDTTRNSIIGGLYQMIQYPDQYDLIRKDRDLIPAAVNEIIRWQSSVAHMRRTALEDSELKGKRIKKRDKVVMWYVSGNRDDGAYDAPDTFNIKRAGPRHLSFGQGIHYCVGARLADLQLKWLWEEMLDQHPCIESMGPPKRLRSNFISGIKSLPVKIMA